MATIVDTDLFESAFDAILDDEIEYAVDTALADVVVDDDIDNMFTDEELSEYEDDEEDTEDTSDDEDEEDEEYSEDEEEYADFLEDLVADIEKEEE